MVERRHCSSYRNSSNGSIGAAIIIGTSGIGTISMASTLLIEGAKDIYAGIKGAISGNFNFKDYFIGKAISLTVSAVAMGWQNFKTGISAIKDGVVTCAKVVKTYLIGNTLGTELIQQGASSIAKKELVKQIAIQTLKDTGTREVLGFLAGNITDSILAEFEDKINDSVKRKILDLMK